MFELLLHITVLTSAPPSGNRITVNIDSQTEDFSTSVAAQSGTVAIRRRLSYQSFPKQLESYVLVVCGRINGFRRIAAAGHPNDLPIKADH